MSLSSNGLSGLPQFYPANTHLIVPQVSFGGVTNGASISYDSRFPIFEGDNRGSFSDTFSMAFARHLVKAGFNYEFNNTQQSFASTCYAICIAFGTNASNPLNSNYAFSNAVLGNFLTYQQSNRRTFHGGVNWVTEAFVQDSWKPSRRLTLELGVRASSAHPYTLNTPIVGYPEDLADNGHKEEGASYVPARFDKAKQVRLYVPAIVNGTRVALDPVTGQSQPAALIGFIVQGSGDPFNGLVTQTDPTAKNGWRNPPARSGSRGWDSPTTCSATARRPSAEDSASHGAVAPRRPVRSRTTSPARRRSVTDRRCSTATCPRSARRPGS